MKGLALNIMFALMIAVIAVLLFISFVTGALRQTANWFYCDIYFKTISFFLGQETASIPKSCLKVVDTSVNIVDVREQDNEIFSRKLLAYIIVCWKEAEIKQLYETHPCYELHLMKLVDNVTEENVTSILINEDHCKSIENSDYGCGGRNQILWDVGEGIITNQKIILIKYDNSTESVKVIG